MLLLPLLLLLRVICQLLWRPTCSPLLLLVSLPMRLQLALLILLVPLVLLRLRGGVGAGAVVDVAVVANVAAGAVVDAAVVDAVVDTYTRSRLAVVLNISVDIRLNLSCNHQRRISN